MSLRKRGVALAIGNEVKSSNRKGCDCFSSLAMTVTIFVQLLIKAIVYTQVKLPPLIRCFGEKPEKLVPSPLQGEG
jgi:hypothetical protein